MKNKKNIIISLISLIFIFSLAACGNSQEGNQVMQTQENAEAKQENQESKEDSKEITEIKQEESEKIDTSNWLIYKNEEYGFSFEYPSDWEVAKYTDNDCGNFLSVNSVKKGDLKNTPCVAGDSIVINYFSDINNEVHLVDSDVKVSSLEEFIKLDSIQTENFEIKETKVEGANNAFIVWKGGAVCNYAVVLDTNNGFFEIVFEKSLCGDESELNNDLFKLEHVINDVEFNIFDSFKFTK